MYVTGQRESCWKLKQKMDRMRSYETKLAESNDGHWQNIRKYVGDQANRTSNDPSERCVEFMSRIIEEIGTFIVECKMLRSNLFDKENTVKTWKANELLFLENTIKNFLAIEGKMVKVKRDILQNINYLKRRVVESDAIQHDNTCCTRRTKKKQAQVIEEKRKTETEHLLYGLPRNNWIERYC